VERWDVSLDWIYYGDGTAMPKQLLQKIDPAGGELGSCPVRSSGPNR